MMNDLNENPNFLYDDTPDRKLIVISDYNEMLIQAEKDVKPYFERLPKSKVEIRAVFLPVSKAGRDVSVDVSGTL